MQWLMGSTFCCGTVYRYSVNGVSVLLECTLVSHARHEKHGQYLRMVGRQVLSIKYFCLFICFSELKVNCLNFASLLLFGCLKWGAFGVQL